LGSLVLERPVNEPVRQKHNNYLVQNVVARNSNAPGYSKIWLVLDRVLLVAKKDH